MKVVYDTWVMKYCEAISASNTPSFFVLHGKQGVPHTKQYCLCALSVVADQPFMR